MTTAERTRQREKSLEEANRVRYEWRDLKGELKDGRVGIGDALTDPRGSSWPVLKLLMAQRGWGENRAKRLLDGLSISALRRIGDLTDRQRAEITVFVENGQRPKVPKHRSLQDYAARKAAEGRLRELKLVEQRCKQLGLEANRTATHVIVKMPANPDLDGVWLSDLDDLAFLQYELAPRGTKTTKEKGKR